VASWYHFNPNYEIILLDNNNISNYLDIKSPINYSRRDFTIQIKCELQRLALLRKYGGVYTDATTFCTKPLDDWLPDYLRTDFFTFRNPGADRLIATWFFAAEKNNPLLVALHDAYFNLFIKTKFWNKNRRIGNSLTHRLVPRFNGSIKKSLFWHTLFAKKILRVYPYYMCHYTFNKVILENHNLESLWNSAPPFEADIPHRLQQLKEPTKSIKKALLTIDKAISPMYKFDRRRNYSEPYWKSVIDHLSKLIE